MKKLIKSKLVLQVIVASMVATLATVGIVGAVTTVGENISTGGTLTVTGASALTGNLAVDTNILLVDVTNNKVGIGTTTPFATLSVNNVAGQNAFVIGSSTATWLKVDEAGVLTVAKAATFSSTLAVTGTFASGAATITGAVTGVTNLTASGNLAFATASSTSQVKVDTLGVASTTPANGYQLSVGNGASASSTVSMGKFCMFAGQENGTMVYIRLSSTAANNQPFATSTIPCN